MTTNAVDRGIDCYHVTSPSSRDQARRLGEGCSEPSSADTEHCNAEPAHHPQAPETRSANEGRHQNRSGQLQRDDRYEPHLGLL